MSHTNKHADIGDPGNLIIAKVDTTGAAFLPPSAGAPAKISKGAAGQITGVHGTVAATDSTQIVFDNPGQ